MPALHGEKVASRAQILKKAAEYIQYMRKKNTVCQQDIDDLKRQNALLDSQSNNFNSFYVFNKNFMRNFLSGHKVLYKKLLIN